jgi:hypothetical protein
MYHVNYNIPQYIDPPEDVYFIESDEIFDEDYPPHVDAYIANVYQYYSAQTEYRDRWVIKIDNIKEFIIKNGKSTVEQYSSGWINVTLHDYDYSKRTYTAMSILS